MSSNNKQSKKGGASSHLRPCKTAYCDKHNERMDENPSNKNIRHEFSSNNTIWKDPGVPNLVTLDRQIRNDYYKAHGRHMPERGPSKASPLKESVTMMPNGGKETDEIQRRIINRIENEFHIHCIRMYNHRDEYCDETGEFNWHGHEVWDMYDHHNHRIRTLSRSECRKWQDIVAEETGMPRGNPAYETRRKWLSANEYKIACQEVEIAKNEEKIEETAHDVDEQFMLKDALESHIHGLESKKVKLEKENAELEEKTEELQKKYNVISKCYAIGVNLYRTIVIQLQEIVDSTTRTPMEVVGFFVETEKLTLTSPGGQPVEHEAERYIVNVKNTKGEILSIIAKNDDYYKAPADSLQRAISKLFANINGQQRQVIRSMTKKQKKPGPQL